jgi:serine/threonine-protein kinase
MKAEPRTVGRYTIFGEIAAGGMAKVHLGKAAGHGGFARTVAVKCMYPQFASDPEFVAMFLDEAWLAARIHHPNVVQTIDVVSQDGELFLVMDYVHGETLSRIWRTLRESGQLTPVPIVVSIVSGILHGLHAAHEAKDDSGKPLHIVHRDVSPQNVIVGADGVARLLDFGVAKAAVRLQSTHDGQIKGKIPYMAPEQLDHHEVSRASDIYAAGVVLWEGLTGRKLFEAETEGQLVSRVLAGKVDAPSSLVPDLPPALDAVCLRALSHEPGKRFATAREMALALERATEVARASQVSEWLEQVAGALLAKRAARVEELLSSVSGVSTPRSIAPATKSESSQVRSLEKEATVPAPGSSRPSLPTTTTPTGRGAGPKRAGRRVLVIDDSEIILDKVRRALEAEGYEVTATTRTVGNARHLVDCDLVIIDYHMPGLDGGSVISSLRSAAASGGHPCLFYLYTQDPSVARDYAKLGFDGCFTEKGDEKALVRQVRSAFRVVQMRALRK